MERRKKRRVLLIEEEGLKKRKKLRIKTTKMQFIEEREREKKCSKVKWEDIRNPAEGEGVVGDHCRREGNRHPGGDG